MGYYAASSDNFGTDVSGQPFGPIFRGQDSWTSVRNYHYSLRNNPEERSSHLLRGVFTLDAGLLARSQYSEGPATGHLDTGFSWFPCV